MWFEKPEKNKWRTRWRKGKKFKADFIETSVFSGENLHKAFEKLMNGIYQKNYKQNKENIIPSNNEEEEKNESKEKDTKNPWKMKMRN